MLWGRIPTLSLPFILFLCLALSVDLSSALDHSGAIQQDETWTLADSPHIITGDVTVNDGVTLTIEAGCEVKFNKNTRLSVYGKLVADGNASKHITFTSNEATPSAGDWKNIYFYYADPGTILDYCGISYGGSYDGILKIHNSSENVTISNCTIQHSAKHGIYISSSSPSITGCTITNNSSMGIYCYDSASKPQISDCVIQNNGDYAIRVFADSVKNITGTMTISGNGKDAILVGGEKVYTGTWLNHGVPYDIGGDITVENGNTLTINPGNTLRFVGEYYLYVYGTLVADGDSSNHITFTSGQSTPSAGDWKYIYFVSPDSGTILDYCDISYGGSYEGILGLLNTSSDNLTISNCTIQHSANSGIFMDDSSPNIQNCTIQNNSSHGIHMKDGSSPNIQNCTIQNNTGYGIFAETGDCNPTISGGSIENNNSYALRLPPDPLRGLTGVTITGNNPNAIEVMAGNVTADATWDHSVDYYYISGDVYVNNGVSLTIGPGRTLKFSNSALIVYGSLVADGDASNHITDTSNQETRNAGDRKYIEFN